MNINTSFHSIEQMTSQLLAADKRKNNPANNNEHMDFNSVFSQKVLKERSEGLTFSKHANQRLVSRNIDLSKELQKQLGLYHQSIVDSLNDITTEEMKKLVSESKNKAPVGNRKKHYKYNITSTTTYQTKTGIIKTWYVKAPDYRLTHLIVNGHANRDGSRTKANDFLSPIVLEVEKEFEEKVKEVIKNG